MMWWIYQVLFSLALVLVGPWYAVRRRGDLWAVVRGRLVWDPPPAIPRGSEASRPLWIHAVSVGEVVVAAVFIRALPADLPVVVTAVTPTGIKRARALFEGRATVAWMPLDLGGPLRRFLAATDPRGLVLVEGDYWPLALERCSRAGIPLVVINGRVGDRSFRRLSGLRWVVRWLQGRADRVGAQSPLDRERLLALGIEPARVEVTGNLKFDAVPSACPVELAQAIERLAAGRPVVVAGSTMAGEDRLVLDAWSAAGGAAAMVLILAPRHPERFEAVAALLAERGVRFLRRSGDLAQHPADVILLDSLGELAGVYGLGAIAFVGGTLVPTGGHNPIEPALHGVAITVGNSQENFRDVAAMFDRAGAWSRVTDGEHLGRVWRRWLDHPQEREAVGRAAQLLVEASRGAAARSLELVQAEIALTQPGTGPA